MVEGWGSSSGWVASQSLGSLEKADGAAGSEASMGTRSIPTRHGADLTCLLLQALPFRAVHGGFDPLRQAFPPGAAGAGREPVVAVG